ncbi:alanine racemase [Beijerinckia sp. L45]|uniref:alanine racemase n=1 Tax=Beijerinckia sp. L45 TaxID=1641855 RepID=UPI00131A83AF|nr:alanine racemase [Beijerinckia sp. L45]
MQSTDRTRAPPPVPSEAAGATLTVDLAAIAANYRLLQGLVGTATCTAVIKADAYGLGVRRVAPALARAGCRSFFVAHASEGATLREVLGPAFDIAVLHGTLPGGEAVCRDHDLVPVLNDRGQIGNWKALAARRGERLPAILQIDTGMARFGLSIDETLALLDDPQAFEGIDLRLLMSHLACADDPENPANVRQLAAFRDVRRRFPGVPASLAASSGIFLGRDYHFDLVRPGAALYGLAPQAGRPGPMRPVVGLCGRVIQVRSVPTGTPIGYGHSAVTTRDSRLATVGVGYADGFLRSASAVREVRWKGRRLPVVGHVSMDSIILDVTEIPADALGAGALVHIIGAGRDVDAVAADAGTIGYEILAGLGHRYHRSYIDV